MADILMTGLVSCRNSDDPDEYIFKDRKNKFTTYGMQTIPCNLNILYTYGGGAVTASIGLCSYNSTWNMYMGTNTNTGTTSGMTALTSPIGTTPGTVPSSKSVATLDGTSTGIWACTWTAIWNTGVISGNVGEMALYLIYDATTTSGGWYYSNGVNGTTQTTPGMYSRLCNADGDFSTFAIDTTKPVIVDWKIQLTYA